jgi:hypothetical protein
MWNLLCDLLCYLFFMFLHRVSPAASVKTPPGARGPRGPQERQLLWRPPRPSASSRPQQTKKSDPQTDPKGVFRPGCEMLMMMMMLMIIIMMMMIIIIMMMMMMVPSVFFSGFQLLYLWLERSSMLQMLERCDFGQTEENHLSIWKALKCQLWSGRKFPRLGNIFLGTFDRHIST